MQNKNETHKIPAGNARWQAWRSQEVLHGQTRGLRQSGRGHGNGGPLSSRSTAVPSGRRTPEIPKTLENLNAYDLGHSPLYDPIFAMKDAHCADETGRGVRKRSVLRASSTRSTKSRDRQRQPLELRDPGQGQLQDRRRDGQPDLRRATTSSWSMAGSVALVQPLPQHPHPQDRRVLRQLGVQRGVLHQHHPGRTDQPGNPRQHCLLRLHRLSCRSTARTSTRIALAKCIVELTDEVRDNIKGMADWGALGAVIADKAQQPDHGRAQPAQQGWARARPRT